MSETIGIENYNGSRGFIESGEFQVPDMVQIFNGYAITDDGRVYEVTREIKDARGTLRRVSAKQVKNPKRIRLILESENLAFLI